MPSSPQRAMQLAQDIETFMFIVKWVIGLMVPIFGSLVIAIKVLWNRLREKDEEIKTLRDENKSEMRHLWETTHGAFLKSSDALVDAVTKAAEDD